MSCNWPLKRISEVANFENSKRVPLKSLDRAKRQGEFPYYGASGVVDYIDDFIFDGNYLLISEDGENLRTRNTPIAFQATGKFWVNNHAHIFSEKEEGILDYLEYYFSILNIGAYITGAVQPKLNKANLDKIEIPIPPLEDRLKLNGILNSFRDKVRLNNRTNRTLEEMAQAIFKSWFVDFDPVKAKMNGELPDGMDAATASLFPEKLVDSELGLIPEGWEAKPLGDYLTIKRGGSPRPIKEFIVPDGYPWTKIADATANDNPYIFKTKEFIKEEGLKKTVYLKKGTLILSNSATPGLPRFLELDACIHDGWLHFPEKKHFTDSYLYQLFLHIRKHLVSQGNGSVFTNLKTDILRNQVVLVPPKELVDTYEKHAGKFLETVKAKSIESNQLAQLRDTLLPKLLSGEIDLEAATEN
ncbi:restriction endonuclease subunit S [Vibrio sp. M260118]|uniref:restriction endonuclease subunit S n=1 Tax=Vibrio sp. M260118 TaxID=3020896 RepID=UPI002F4213B0